MMASLERESSDLVAHYLRARAVVIREGYADEIAWQAGREMNSLTEQAFLAEHAWVTMAAGLSDHVVRSRYPRVAEAFGRWVTAQHVVETAPACRSSALRCFGHEGKIEAMITAAHIVHEEGFPSIKDRIAADPIPVLREFPFIGPVTVYHLAKNCGLNLAKPDRHLVRLADRMGYSDVQQLCGEIAEATGDPVAVVDLVLWRHATIANRGPSLF